MGGVCFICEPVFGIEKGVQEFCKKYSFRRLSYKNGVSQQRFPAPKPPKRGSFSLSLTLGNGQKVRQGRVFDGGNKYFAPKMGGYKNDPQKRRGDTKKNILHPPEGVLTYFHGYVCAM